MSVTHGAKTAFPGRVCTAPLTGLPAAVVPEAVKALAEVTPVGGAPRVAHIYLSRTRNRTETIAC